MYRAVLIVLMFAMTGVAGWFTYNQSQHVRDAVELESARAEIDKLSGALTATKDQLAKTEADLEASEREVQELTVRLALLKIDHRVARIEVVGQEPSADDPDRVVTTIRFLEFDRTGEQTGPEQLIEIEGTRLYLETLVIKFDDQYVEAGEFLRGTSLCLFNRVFSERVAPKDGVEIDQPGTHPTPYLEGDSEMELYHAELWDKFWEYANNPEAAATKGVRAIHGEAPFMEVRPGKSYRVELRSSGGLSIQPE
jgi:hypothetical protein